MSEARAFRGGAGVGPICGCRSGCQSGAGACHGCMGAAGGTRDRVRAWAGRVELWWGKLKACIVRKRLAPAGPDGIALCALVLVDVTAGASASR